MSESTLGGSLRSDRADSREVEGDQLGPEGLAAVPNLSLRVAEADDDDVLRANERRASFDVADLARAVPCDQRNIHGRGLTRGLGRGLVEVRVSVEKQEPGTSAATEGERPAQQHAAIASEDERHVADIEQRLDGVGESERIRDDFRPVEYAARLIADSGRRRGRDGCCDSRVERPCQTVPQKRLCEPCHPGCAQPETRGRLNDGEPAFP